MYYFLFGIIVLFGAYYDISDHHVTIVVSRVERERERKELMLMDDVPVVIFKIPEKHSFVRGVGFPENIYLSKLKNKIL